MSEDGDVMKEFQLQSEAWLALELLQDASLFGEGVWCYPEPGCGWVVVMPLVCTGIGSTLLDAVVNAVDNNEALDLSPCMQCGRPCVCIPDGMPICRQCGETLEASDED